MKKLEHSRILITGGAGFIGSNLCEAILNLGYKVKCLDDLSTGKQENIDMFLDNPNLMYAFNKNPEIGTIRETFFYNQMKVRNDVIASKESDFTIDNYTFEIGGKKKGKKQIEDIPNGYIVRDDIEYGNDIIIPLWHFGLNY